MSQQKKTMSRQKDENERIEECHDSVFYVAKFQTYVAT